MRLKWVIFLTWLLLVILKEARSDVFPALEHIFDILEIHSQHFTSSYFRFWMNFFNGIYFCF